MRRTASTFVITALLLQGPAVATAQQGQSAPIAKRPLGLCAPLAPLPRLAPEATRQDQQGNRRLPRPAGKVAKAEAMPAPAAPVLVAPPPPAPPMPGTSKASAVADKSDAAASAEPEGRSAIMPDPRRDRRPRPPQQSGQLTAGEHDDLLNPELYASYVRQSNFGQEIQALPVLDTGRLLTVTVRDRSGRPVPFAPVELACADGNRLQLSTLADGTVAFFPQVDRLGRQVRIRAAGQNWRDVAIGSGAGGQRVDFTVATQAQSVAKLDLMLAIDTTGSMGDEIRYLQTELAQILRSLRQRHPGLDLRVGFVFYRDVGDDYVTATVPLSGDFEGGQRALQQQGASGGGDYPEAMEQALIRAAGQQWRPDAAKTLLLVADAPPHDENFGAAWLAARHLRANRVQIVPVAASGVADKAEYAMRAMAALTQSRYTFLTDDSGIGNPHAPPAIDCYLVTRLDALLRRVIDSQLSGRRIEPDQSEVIREVGDYDNGRCIIPPGGLQQ